MKSTSLSPCPTASIAPISKPNDTALKTALTASNGCLASGVGGSAHQPTATAAIPIGTLTANSHGQGAIERIPLATVGPTAAEIATTTALMPMPRPSICCG